MKRILCIVLSLVVLFSFAACGKSKEKETSGLPNNGDIVDIKTVDVINSAFSATEKALESVTSLGFKSEVKLTVTAEGQTVVSTGGTEFRFIKGDVLKVFNKTVLKNDLMNSELYMFTDGVSTYGATAGATYLITSGTDTTKYFADLLKAAEICNTADITPVNVKIVNASGGGYGFVAIYPVDNLPDSLKTLISEQLSKLGNVKGKNLKVSGMINADGRLEAQTVTYDFTYEYEALANDVDPDNLDSNVPTTVKKTAEGSLSVSVEIDYDVTEVTQGSHIVLPTAEQEPLKEMSLADFQILATLSGAVDDDSTESGESDVTKQ